MKHRIGSIAGALSALLFAFILYAPTQAVAAENAAAVARVGEDIRFLASDELEGRGPGTKGLEVAAEYIRDEFKRLGLKSGVEDGSYFQPFEFNMSSKVVKSKTHLVLTGPDGQKLELEIGKDFQPLAFAGNGKAKAEVVFAGYGITAPKLEYDDYKDLDVEGKVVVIIRREPQQDQEKSAFNGKKVTTHSYIRTKVQQAKKNKAAAVLFVNDPFSTKASKKDQLSPARAFAGSGTGVLFAHISQATANRLLKASPVTVGGDTPLSTIEAIEGNIDETLRPISQPLAGWTADLEFNFERVKAKVHNVVGVLEGEGPLADETIVIGAHYDHLGSGPFGSRKPNPPAIHNGADDNASGTAAVMELARRFAQADKKPKRRMVFMGFSAEERGLLGSNYYVKNPLFPLEQTAAMFNFDMIGRLRNNTVTLGGARTGKEFAALAEKANADETLTLKMPNGIGGGSDHMGFIRSKVPSVFFFTGLTKEYHTPQDDYELIDVDGVVKTIDVAHRMIQEVVDLPERPTFIEPSSRPRRGGMAYLGVVPDYDAESKGIKLTTINKDSPAAKGGLKAGDEMLKFADVPVSGINGLTALLRKYKPGDKVKIVVLRDKKEVMLEVTLGRPQSRQ